MSTHTPERFLLKWTGSEYKVNFPAGDIEVECVRADVADEVLEALQELYDATGSSCEDRALNEAQRKAEAILNRS